MRTRREGVTRGVFTGYRVRDGRSPPATCPRRDPRNGSRDPETMTMHETAWRICTFGVLAALGACPALPAQRYEGLRPFRRPHQQVKVPAELFTQLRKMLEIADSPGAVLRYDENGREVCDDPAWRQAYERARPLLKNMGGYLGIILRDSGNPEHRRLAAYGAFYLENIEHVFQLLAFLPGEPERRTREEGYRRAIAFLSVHLPRNREAAKGDEAGAPPAGRRPPHPGEPRYHLNTFPFLCLLELDDPRDQAQGLWFLAEVMRIRPDLAPSILEEARPHLEDLVFSEHDDVRRQAERFVRAADPRHRPAPIDTSRERREAWLQAVLDTVLPPIRKISDGLVEIHFGDKLDRLVAVGRAALEADALGGPEQGRLRSGLGYRGFRIARLPRPLDELGLPLEAVITAINGQPVATAAEILDAVRLWTRHRRALLVEFVHRGRQRAVEFRLKSR